MMKSNTMTRLSLAIVFIATCVAGCGKSTGSLSGKVTYQGKAVPGGRVIFQPPQGSQVSADISESGTYTIANVPVGSVKVAVDNSMLKMKDAVMPSQPKDAPSMKELPGGMPNVKGTWIPLPGSASDPEKSGVSVTVTRGEHPFDIDLK